MSVGKVERTKRLTDAILADRNRVDTDRGDVVACRSAAARSDTRGGVVI